MSKIRVAIVGVGNCASSLVQGVQYYRNILDKEKVPGIMHNILGGYRIRDIEFSCAFDVDENKVGLDLSEAIFAKPNNTVQFMEDLESTNAMVYRGKKLDGVGTYHKRTTKDLPCANVSKVLRETETDVVINYLPVGSEQATMYYITQAIEANCAFINCIPVFAASNGHIARLFQDNNLPIIGDDIKSQVGATIVHRVLTNLFEKRGVKLERTYQLNFGGNMDFYNMLERDRLESKKISKTRAVTSQLSEELEPENVHVGPSDYVPWLEDRKFCHIRMEGKTFGDVPLNLELKLEVYDSPNSAGVVIDAIRCARLALDRRVGGPLLVPSAYFMKSPPQQYSDDLAHELLEEFIAQP